MAIFIQLHMLTSYPPANLNRDDLGRPKTAVMGSVQRLRISSQSLKRAWRTSDLFKKALAGHIGTRTKEMGIKVFNDLTRGGIEKKDAKEWAMDIAKRFGKLKATSLEIEQLTHFSPAETQGIEVLTQTLINEKRQPTEEELNLLRKEHQAIDIALFGRMLAGAPAYNIEAACQVAHAISVHKTAIEDDFFTAVDDLNEGKVDVGAGHLGETEFAAGLFYLYICINRDLLVKNLMDGEDLASKAIRALVEASATVAPIGKQNSFASRAYASYILAEKTNRQPRSLSVAFLKPVTGDDMLLAAIEALEETHDKMDKAYGQISATSYTLNTMTGEGSLGELLDFVGV